MLNDTEAPHVGAGIEMGPAGFVVQIAGEAPHVGAGIEI